MKDKKLSFIFMGVSGSGKSIVAETIAKRLNAPLLDGDFLHPRANIDKMSQGIPLNDEDRMPWLTTLNSSIYAMQRTHTVSTLVCSALKRKYREALRKDNQNLYFIYLKGDFDLIAERMKNRQNHFFKPEMLKSQFEILEEPLNDHSDIKVVDISQSLGDVVEESYKFIQDIINA